MPKTYYDSELTGAQIEDALEAIHNVVTPSNNGKVLYIDNGQIKAASASRWSGGAVLEPLSVTQNGDYMPPTGTDGFDSVHVAVPAATLTTKSITQNGTYNASQDNADGYSSVTVNVSGGGGAVVQPLSVTQNGTYNPPSGVVGYAPVTVDVSGGTQYNYLDEYNAGWSYSGDNANESFYYEDRIMIVTASGGTGTWCTTQPIDFTGKTKLRIVIGELSGNYTAMCRLAISTRPINNNNRGDSWTVFDSGVGTYYLDLPAQKDALYVGAMAWTRSTFTVDEIVAE